MTSTAQAAANAANAQLSTGPRSEAGKARSSRNAVKHGLTAKQLIIAPGEEQEFAGLHDSLYNQLTPEGALEMGIFNMLLHAAWNLERFRTLEAQLVAGAPDPLDSLLDESTAKALDRLQRYASANQRTYFKALKELRTVQTNRLLRRSLDGHDDPLPELVSTAEIAKRTHQVQAADDMAEWRAMKACIDAPIPGLRNEPNRPRAGIRKESAA